MTRVVARRDLLGRGQHVAEPDPDAVGEHLAGRAAADRVAAAVRRADAEGLRVRAVHRRRVGDVLVDLRRRRRCSRCSRSASPATSRSRRRPAARTHAAGPVASVSAADGDEDGRRGRRSSRPRPRSPATPGAVRARAARTARPEAGVELAQPQEAAAGQARSAAGAEREPTGDGRGTRTGYAGEARSTRSSGCGALIRDVPDFPQEGIVFKDITPLLADDDGFSSAIDLIVVQYGRGNVDKVVGIEARGFILASPVAYHFGAGFVPVRKAGKLPVGRRARGVRARVRLGGAGDPQGRDPPRRARPDRGRRARHRRDGEGDGVARRAARRQGGRDRS